MQNEFPEPAEKEIRQNLDDLGIDAPLYYFSECDSTNIRAVEIQKKTGQNFIVISACQNSGHGRFERAWKDETGKSICLSVVFDTSSIDIKNFSSFGILAGICVCSALNDYAGSTLMLKWPNDIYFEGKKLGGMIASLHVSNNLNFLLFGIGLNFAPLKGSGALQYSSLTEAGINKIDINRAAAIVAAALFEAFGRAGKNNPLNLASLFPPLDYLFGREVEVKCGNRTISGTADGVDSHGNLRVISTGGEILLAGAGESTILKK